MSLSYAAIEKYLGNSLGACELYHKARFAGFEPDVKTFQMEKIADYLKKIEMADTSKLDEVIKDVINSIEPFFRHLVLKNTTIYWSINSSFACCLALIYKFPEQFGEEDLISLGWDRKLAKVAIASRNAALQEIS